MSSNTKIWERMNCEVRYLGVLNSIQCDSNQEWGIIGEKQRIKIVVTRKGEMAHLSSCKR